MVAKAISWFYAVEKQKAKELQKDMKPKTISYVVHTYKNKNKFLRK